MAKKRANGEGTIRKRSNGTWEARITIDGKSKSFYGKTQTQAIQAKKDFLKALDNGINLDAGKLQTSQWMKIWFDEFKTGIKPSTRARYEVDIRVHINPAIGKIKLAKLEAPVLQRMYNQSLQNGLSPKSVRNLHGVMHGALEQAVRLGYISKNVSDYCDPPKVPKVEMHPLKDAEIPAFLEAIQGHIYEPLYRLALFTGMREGEVLGLTWDCIDFTRGTIHLYRQLQRERIKGRNGNYQFVPLKNSKERTIRPAKQVMEMLRRIRIEQAQMEERNREIWNNDWNLVFTNEAGRYLVDRTVYRNFKKIVGGLGLPKVRFHDLRHTYATLSIQNGDDIKIVSRNLGHATVAFTMDVYGHVSETMRSDSASRMERYIDSL